MGRIQASYKEVTGIELTDLEAQALGALLFGSKPKVWGIGSTPVTYRKASCLKP